MIPQFPEFKRLELSDKKEAQHFTATFPPYADFNFVGTWTWDVREKMEISQLYGNYLIRFCHYETGESFYTFLGDKKVNDTAQELLALSLKDGIGPMLRLVPEISITHLDKYRFSVTEDRDNFDYILDVRSLKSYEGGPFASKRGMVHRFLKTYPNAMVQTIDIGEQHTRDQIVNLYKKWIDDKTIKNDAFEEYLELEALERFFLGYKEFNLLSIGIYIKDVLIAYSINELLAGTEFAISHVVKADISYAGLYAYLTQQTAEALWSQGIQYLNYEQDLGMEKLRAAKLLLRPKFFLKKYNVQLSTP